MPAIDLTLVVEQGATLRGYFRFPQKNIVGAAELVIKKVTGNVLVLLVTSASGYITADSTNKQINIEIPPQALTAPFLNILSSDTLSWSLTCYPQGLTNKNLEADRLIEGTAFYKTI